MKRGALAESLRARRILVMAAFRLASNSTKVVRPHEVPQLLARDYLVRPAHQDGENAGWLLLKGHAAAVAAQDALVRSSSNAPKRTRRPASNVDISKGPWERGF